jgi:glycolate oxidase
MADTIVSAFAEVLSGPDTVASDAAILAENGKDYWGFGRQPGLVLRPRTRDEIVAIVKVAAHHDVSLVTRGGASNCSAGVIADADRVVIRRANPTAT